MTRTHDEDSSHGWTLRGVEYLTTRESGRPAHTPMMTGAHMAATFRATRHNFKEGILNISVDIQTESAEASSRDSVLTILPRLWQASRRGMRANIREQSAPAHH